MTTFKSVLFIPVILLLLTACVKEESDFINEPTAESIYFCGSVTTSGGAPIESAIVGIDYVRSVYLAGYTVRHKAECKTDKSGDYRLFFNSNDDERNDEDNVNKYYNLNVDLSRLSSDIYMKPLTSENKESDKWSVSFTNEIPKGETFEFDFFIPKKRMVKVVVKDAGYIHSDRDRFAISNRFRYGDRDAQMMTPVEILPDKSTQTFEIPMAVGTENRVVLQCLEGGSGAYEDVGEVVVVDVTASSPEMVELCNNPVPDKYRFKLSQQFKSTLARPFDPVTYRITDKDGHWSAFDAGVCQYYDSIVWNSVDLPGRVAIYKRDKNYNEQFQSQWSSYFFDKGTVTTRLQGYRKGRVVYADSIKTTLYPEAFLCFDWNTLHLTEGSFTAYNQLDNRHSFRVVSPHEESDGHVVAKVSVLKNDGEYPDNYTIRTRFALVKLMEQYFGDFREIDSEDTLQLFPPLKDYETPQYLWQSQSTNVMLVKVAADEETLRQEHYYLLAAKRQ